MTILITISAALGIVGAVGGAYLLIESAWIVAKRKKDSVRHRTDF